MVGAVVGIIEAGTGFILVPLIFGKLSPAAQGVAMSLLVMVALYMPAWNLTTAQYFILLAGGESKTMSRIETLINVFVFLPSAFLLSRFTTLGPVALYAVIKLASLIKPLMTHFELKKGEWVKNLT